MLITTGNFEEGLNRESFVAINRLLASFNLPEYNHYFDDDNLQTNMSAESLYQDFLIIINRLTARGFKLVCITPVLREGKYLFRPLTMQFRRESHLKKIIYNDAGDHYDYILPYGEGEFTVLKYTECE